MSGKEGGELVPAPKRFKRVTPSPREGFDLSDLPDVALEEIAKYLDQKDLFNFSHTCSKVWRLVGRKSSIWATLLKNLNLPASPKLDSLATHCLSPLPVGCDEKRRFLVYRKTLNNWKTGNIVQIWMHMAQVFAERNDVMAFGRRYDNGSRSNITVSGPAIALNWSFDHPSTHDLGKIFIFKKTVCAVLSGGE